MIASLHTLPVALETPARAEQTAVPTQAQQIAGERLAIAAGRIGRITGAPFITPIAKAQARELRRDIERLCGELRRAGL